MPYPINQRAHQFNSIQSVPVSFGLWDTALKFLSPGPRSDVTDHLEKGSRKKISNFVRKASCLKFALSKVGFCQKPGCDSFSEIRARAVGHGQSCHLIVYLDLFFFSGLI